MTGRTMETLRYHHDSYRNVPGFKYSTTRSVHLMSEQCQILSTAFTQSHPVETHYRVQYTCIVNIFRNVQNILGFL
jgi:hypothetical protein